jgi:twitching motility protein PilT
LKKEGGGRVGAFEILVGTNAVRNLIRENQVPQLFSMMQTGSRYGMITMEDAVKDLYDAEIISKDEARRAMLKASDQEEEPEEGYAAASLGGGKIGEAAQSTPQGSSGKAPKKAANSGEKADGDYSF